MLVSQHCTGPVGGGQRINAHPVGQPGSDESCADIGKAFADKFLLKNAICTHLPLLSGAACTDGSVVEGMTDASSAQTGATIRADNNNSIFFMAMLLVVD